MSEAIMAIMAVLVGIGVIWLAGQFASSSSSSRASVRFGRGRGAAVAARRADLPRPFGDRMQEGHMQIVGDGRPGTGRDWSTATM